ncbi:uncharacterized protein LOC123866013 isoform X2 [Maniola jurtina]|uniref:uncharacterized protein LOC123866013 isoform X1 n=1 Tax=Maniola jurtina TaxID=191418 RepID=UPI001E68E916|nr:uncharacterized protein LOC123866013 isoform X1 [Maniola jurtina]XP_045763261.1 uncharacterized protein LOC123866013 isoform X2 [Maniola jurtina]
MGGKWSIAIFLVLCFAWQVKGAVTCTANGRYPDPADLTCKNYTLCVALSNTSFIGYNYVCPNASLFNPAIAQCTSNYVCNVRSVCTTEGFFEDPNSSNCSTFISCVNIGGTFVQTTLSCPPNTFYNPVTTLCEPDYNCVFICRAAGRYANPADRSCNTYFLCVNANNGTIAQYQYACPTVSVFSPATSVCTTSYTCPTS